MEKLPINLTEVKAFVDDYIKQDNRCTSWPYSYVVQQKKKVAAYNGCGETEWMCQEAEIFDAKSEGDMIDQLKEQGYENWKDMDIYSNQVEETWEDVQWFFTEKAALDYVANDKWNLSPTRTYVKPLRRNSEAVLILKTMFALAECDYEEASRK